MKEDLFPVQEESLLMLRISNISVVIVHHMLAEY